MGWGYGVLNDGREVGYSVPAECEQPGCGAPIDRGLSYLCGSMHGQDDQHGCGRYFCEEHLFHMFADCVTNAMCGECVDAHGGQDNEQSCEADDDG